MQGAEREGGAATVVISLRVREGREGEYEDWQTKIDAVAETFAGFEGSEVLRPRAGVQDDWVVVYRFDSAATLTDWMRSEARSELLEQAAPYLQRRSEHIVATPGGSARPVTVVVSQRVDPAHDTEYEAWQRGITTAASKFAGFLGSETFEPVAGVQDEWVVVFRFASPSTLQRWLDSDVRQRWLDKSRRWVRDVEIQTVGGGLGGWFPIAATSPSAAPPWKQAMTVLLVLYPTVMLLNLSLVPRLASFTSASATVFASNLASVAILTWLAMPSVTRWLAPWLTSANAKTSLTGAGLIAAAYAAMVVGFGAVG